MAKRPVFIPGDSKENLLREIEPEFKWFAGFAISQKQLSIQSLHNAARGQNVYPILEISSKSKETLGQTLSAFNLLISGPDHEAIPLECLFQSSKVFRDGSGPFPEIRSLSPRDAKRFHRPRMEVPLSTFQYLDIDWPLEPKTLFYDWIYLKALSQLPVDTRAQILHFEGFTDIEFNKNKSVNCQAKSAALFVALSRLNLFEEVINDIDRYIEIRNLGRQQRFFD